MTSMLDFPDNPTTNQIFAPAPNLPVWTWDGSKWIGTAGDRGDFGFPDPNADGMIYGRQNNAWAQTLMDAPTDAKTYGRRDGAWQEVLPIEQAATPDTLYLPINATIADGTWRYRVTGGAALLLVADNWLNFYSAASGTAGAPVSWHPGMTLRTQGLSVNGSINVQGGGFNVGQGECLLWAGCRYSAWAPYNNLIGFTWWWPTPGYLNVLVDGGGAVYPIADAASDERVKQDIAPSTFDCLNAIEQIPLHQFRWMDQSTPGQPKPVEQTPESLIPVGIIAQRLYEVVPSFVVRPPDVQAVSPPLKAQLRVWSIQQNNMLAALIGAVQTLAARVEELEARHA
jgi:hypothetical protein